MSSFFIVFFSFFHSGIIFWLKNKKQNKKNFKFQTQNGIFPGCRIRISTFQVEWFLSYNLNKTNITNVIYEWDISNKRLFNTNGSGKDTKKKATKLELFFYCFVFLTGNSKEEKILEFLKRRQKKEKKPKQRKQNNKRKKQKKNKNKEKNKTKQNKKGTFFTFFL